MRCERAFDGVRQFCDKAKAAQMRTIGGSEDEQRRQPILIASCELKLRNQNDSDTLMPRRDDASGLSRYTSVGGA